MSGFGKTLVVVAVLVVLGLVVGGILVGVGVSKYNTLVALHENANAGKSRFASAFNLCSEKMKSVWALADQEGILEKETYVGVAKARSAFEEARQSYDAAAKDPASSILDLTTRAAALGQSLLNIRVAFEAYPQLRTSETSQQAMAAVEEGFNEIKTALDDWIGLCRSYNAQRRSFPTNWYASTFFGPQFPERIAYYEGGITEPEQIKLEADKLNPRAP